METTKTSMDFIDECVAELRLNDDVTEEPGKVTDTTEKEPDGIKITPAEAGYGSEATEVACERGVRVAQVTGENGSAAKVRSSITLTLTPITKSSEEEINPTEPPTRISACNTMVTNIKGSNRPANELNETSCLPGNGIVGHVDLSTTCPVCGNSYTDPRVLPCLHSACLHCIYTLLCPGGPEEQVKRTNGHTQLLLNCPLCAVRMVISTDVENLPPNSLISAKSESIKRIKRNVGEIQRPPAVLCDFCCEEERAIAMVTCVDCASDLCQLCADSHRRQRRTNRHRLVSMSTPGTAERRASDTSCDVTALRQLSQDAIHRKDDIQKILDNIPSTKKELNENAQAVTKEIGLFIDSFIKAVELHRKSLLQQVSTVLQAKETKVQQQENHLCQLLSSFENGCSIADDLSLYGTESEIAALETTVSIRLNKLIDISTHECVPIDTTFTFCPEVKAEVFENFQMFGQVQGSQVCPRKCHVSTTDLTSAQVDIPSTVTLTTKDAEGAAFPNAQGLCAWLKCGVNGHRRQTVTVSERDDAAYDLTFTPRQSGQHQLFVMVGKQDIPDCPFKFEVKPKWREHTGTWQCCTFCSSAGKMDVPCGCGSIVRGNGQSKKIVLKAYI
ncbi:Tripartite motif-containing protein 45 [Mizuhopecten yessoensis]|uniref:Tripartite motif-containing protein 45 n=1 Tax=Mizuhopecten yessoensis TaxID=6573 RepID=A0A210Q6J6_MIZYE|nr:Tripartite motif-containing protein 45 [Mizuhopecten yessoensis]